MVKANSVSGLDKDSKVLLNRVRAIDKKFCLRDYCGVVDKEIMEKVDKGLELVLNIRKILRKNVIATKMTLKYLPVFLHLYLLPLHL